MGSDFLSLHLLAVSIFFIYKFPDSSLCQFFYLNVFSLFKKSKFRKHTSMGLYSASSPTPTIPVIPVAFYYIG